ncbi:hypothetical protein BCR36DRAFT_140152 [Piromyces finnis]|uniref:Protein FRA10AC1 n=1 Tax=Piromyces finnis TaxID=1754191 RepID=A0A1Y1V025_9FUNG|nr:hypothetical protein BCR36DRAFT_140152 [Piromyces finnis]|eukprot:ORX43757.1 hypothetical protein BCR36DRAFT_140152 [Piromyces finnis]
MNDSLPGHFRIPIRVGIQNSFHNNLKGLDAYSRHKKLINDYFLYYNQTNNKFKKEENVQTEYDILKKEFKFIRTEKDNDDSTWEKRIAKKYYDKLYKEYCLANLKYYKEDKIALRWRIERELISGKGQFICGNVDCTETENLHSWEVNFAYKEDNEKKNALVKLRLCPKCSYKLNYKKIKQLKREEKKRRKHKHISDNRGSDSDRHSRKRKHHSTETEYKYENIDYVKQLIDEQGKEKKKVKFNNESSNNCSEKTEIENINKSEDDYRTIASEIWSKSLPKEDDEEKTKEEEYDEYFADLFS